MLRLPQASSEGWTVVKRSIISVLIWISRRLGDDNEYPQTWYLIVRRPRWIQWILRSLCGLVIGHEPSLTEWCYGGGAFVERNCRWCDKVIYVPKDSVIDEFPEAEGLISEFDARTHVQ